MNNCKICKIGLKHKSAKVCGSKTCKSEWKKQRNALLPLKVKTCKQCDSIFKTKDNRNNFCGSKCKTAATSSTNHERYGYTNTAVAWNNNASPEDLAKASENKAMGSRKAWVERKPEILAKRNANNIEKYGVPCTFNIENHSDARKQTNITNYGVKSAGIVGILKRNNLASYQDFADQIIGFLEANNANPYSRLAKDYLKTTFDVTYEVMDDVLAFTGRDDLLNKFKSTPESELCDFVTQYVDPEQVLVNTRPDFMEGLELDLFIPHLNLGIEYHGLAHHSERPVWGEVDIPKVKAQHYKKYALGKAAGVKVVQIFEDEWSEKRDIIESMLKNRMGVTGGKIMARKCGVVELSNKEAFDFFNKTHISGGVNCAKAYGLHFEDELVAVISMRKTWNKAYGNVWEIARFANKLDTTVMGGFQKLFKVVLEEAKALGFEGILTYADCRFGSGDVYLKSGFEHVGITKPNYFYERNGIREARFKHRKSATLEGSTEREQQNLLGWYAVYDAGNEIYVLTL